MSPALVAKLNFQAPDEAMHAMMAALEQFAGTDQAAELAVRQDAAEALEVAPMPGAWRPRDRSRQAEVVMQAEQVTKKVFINFVCDLLQSRELSSISTDEETLDYSSLVDLAPNQLAEYLATQSFRTGFVSWASEGNQTKHRYCELRT